MTRLNGILAILSCMALLTVIPSGAPSAASSGSKPQEIVIDISKTGLPVSIKQGFLNGFPFNGLPLDRVDKLQPRFWRVSDLDQAAYLKKHFPGIKITFVFVDWYMNQRKNHWDKTDWKRWDQNDYENTLRQSVIKGANIVDYWDTWPEPDWSFKGTQAQLHEIYIRTHNVIRNVKPDAKIIGPDLSKWSPQIIKDFLQFCADNNLHFDAISWHENGIAGERPEQVAEHVATARKYMKEIKGICTSSCPEISINEFSAPQNHLVPGWTLAWLAAFESSGVESVARACWQTMENGPTYSDCWKGLNGLLTADGKNTKPLYWVHEKYAHRSGALELRPIYSGITGNGRLTVLASYDRNSNTIQILLGRHSCGKNNRWCAPHEKPVTEDGFEAIPVTLKLAGFPADQTQMTYEIQKIPNKSITLPLPAPQSISKGTLAPAHGNVLLGLDALEDGDVMEIMLKIQGR